MRSVSRLILSAVFLLLSVLLAAVAFYLPEMVFPYYTNLSKSVLLFLSTLTGPFPTAVWEVLLVLVVLLALYFLFHNKKPLRWLTGVALLVSVLVFLFTALWGVNHFAPSVAEQMDLHVTEYSEAQLQATAQYMADQASLYADRVPRDEAGVVAARFSELAKKAAAGYNAMAKENQFFAGADAAPIKRLLSGRLFSYMGMTGIFIAHTGECCVNPETDAASLPYTMCHELAHRLTVAGEDEANFCAFLACLENEDPVFQYSGWYSACLYTYNALHQADVDAAAQVWNSMSPTLREDFRRANEHYSRFDGKVQQAAEKANDTYLKVFQEEAGVQSYGQVADLLIAWYLKNIA